MPSSADLRGQFSPCSVPAASDDVAHERRRQTHLVSSLSLLLQLWLLHPSPRTPGAVACGHTAPLIGPTDNGIGRRGRAQRVERRDTLHRGACLRGVCPWHMPQRLTRYTSGRTLWAGAYLHECQRPPRYAALEAHRLQAPVLGAAGRIVRETSLASTPFRPPLPQPFTSCP